MKERLLPFLIKNILWKIALWWCLSLRISVVGKDKIDDLRKTKKNFVVAFWHGSMLVGWFLNRPEKKERMSALVSQSKDGEYLSAIIERWGFEMIRGSSHIGGKEAMQLMVNAVENGSSLSITPDGPKGPRHEMKMGAVRIAQKTGVPLVLMGIAMKNKKQLRSWDKFELPGLFSHVTVCYSEPVIVPKELDGALLDEFKLKMQNQLNELTGSAEKN